MEGGDHVNLVDSSVEMRDDSERNQSNLTVSDPVLNNETNNKENVETDPKKKKEEQKRLEKAQKEKEKEEKRQSKFQEKSNLKKQDSLNSGALLLQVHKVGSEADISGAPSKPPRKAEAAKGGAMMQCRVMLLDGSDYEVEISKNATGQILVDKVCEYVNLLEKDYFSCTYRQNDIKIWLSHDKPISKQLKKSPWVFAFELKFYPPDPTALHEEITRYQVYLQARVDALSGKLPCSFITHSVLGGLAVQSQLGDYEFEVNGEGFEYLKGIRFAPNQTEELLDKISENHKLHRGLNPAEAEMQYLSKVKNLALYGVHIHPTKDKLGEDTSVGVCARGLVINQKTVRIKSYSWPKIIKIAYKRNNFIIQVRPDTPGSKLVEMETYRLPNLLFAKRLWKLAAEHHTFFRLKAPEPDDRGVFWRRSYHFTGQTQFQAQQNSEQINRSGQGVNRATGGRFTDRLRSVDALEPLYSTDRSEETMDYRTMTLDLRHRNKASVAYAAEDNGGERAPGENGMYDPANEDDRAQLYPVKDAAGRVVYMKKSTAGSVGSLGDVFMTLPGQRGGQSNGGGGGPSQDDYRETMGDRRSQVNFLAPPGGEGGTTYGKTPYPGGPGYLTPSGPDYGGYTTPGGQSYMGGPDYGRTGGSQGGYGGPGSPYYGVDDMHRQHGGSGDQMDEMNPNYQNGYGTNRAGPQRDQYGNIIVTKNVQVTMTSRGYLDSGDGLPAYQDDHLNQHGHGAGLGGEGGWTPYSSTMTKTSTRTYTAPDGTLVTEHRTEKDGVVETHIEKRTQIVSDDGGDIDYDKALRDAIRSVTDMNPDLTVEKIEIQTKPGDD